MPRIETVNALESAAYASRILNESWEPTALNYSPEYLKWQFAFPGSTAQLPGILAWSGTEPVGFAGPTRRKMWYRGIETEVAIISFVAVRPAWRGDGLASRIYDVLLEQLKKYAKPILAFALKDSVGERKLLRAFQAAGFLTRGLGTYSTFGSLFRFPVRTSCFIEPIDRNELPPDLFKQCLDSPILWKANDPAQLTHYRSDPRERHLVAIRKANREIIGAAWILRSELNTPSGLQRIPTIDSLFLPSANVEALRALVDFAAQYWNTDAARPQLVIAPNLLDIDRKLIASAGFRQMGTAYNCHLFSWGNYDIFPMCTSTNLEVI